MALILSGRRRGTQEVCASRTVPHFHEESGDCIEEGSQSGVGATEQRREDPVFFFLFLLHCFKSSHRLVSGSPVAGPFVLRVLYCDLLPVMQKETSERWSAKECCKGEHQEQEVVSTALKDSRASLVAQTGKNLPSAQGTWVRSLGQEDPLEKGMATPSSIFAWGIPWTEEPSGLQSMGSQSQTRLSDSHCRIAGSERAPAESEGRKATSVTDYRLGTAENAE